MSFKDLPALEETYDNLASEWLASVRRGDEPTLEMLEKQFDFLELALAKFEV